MANAIKHFMWGYQQHFCISQQCSAERLFRDIDNKLSPEIFLVGIQYHPTPNRHFACVEPEQDFWVQSDDFNELHPISERILNNYPESRLLHSHPLTEQRHNDALIKRSYQDAIKQIIDSHPSKPTELNFYVSFPAIVDCYWVCVVLGLQKNILDSYYLLNRSQVQVNEDRNVAVSVSLLDAAIKEYLAASTEALLKQDPGSELSNINTDELIRSAGDRLMRDVVCRVDHQCTAGMQNFFRACTTISSLNYEKSPGSGRILIGRHNHPAVDQKVEFHLPTKLKNYKAARKLLELASDNLSLFSDSEKVFGLATIGEYQQEDEDLFEIRIIEHHHWELRHDNHILMRVQYGFPSLPSLSFDEQKFWADLPRIFNQISESEIANLLTLVKTAEQEPHGTVLVISEDAESECNRLSKQGIPIKPCKITPEILMHLTPIDGAIMLTPNGICYGIGIILDGRAAVNGDPSRGARFNSTVRYIESSDIPCMAVVMSEDGGVDFIPHLKPILPRSSIDEVITALDFMNTGEIINIREYYKLIEWLDLHRFYLRQEDCDILNPLITTMEDTIHLQSNSAIRIIPSELIPDPQMNENVYYAKE